jgi:hypothetical protein
MPSRNENEFINIDKTSLALDLETLSANYTNLLTRYKQAVLDYTDSLTTQSARPCVKYNANSKDIDQACYNDIWRKAGCTTTGVVNANTNWAKSQTLNGLIYDSFLWATMTDDTHRRGCYGTTEGNPYLFLGIGKDGKLYKCKGITLIGNVTTINSDWSLVNDNATNLAGICTGIDGRMIIACKKDNKVFYKAAYDTASWSETTNNCCVISVAMGQDGTLVGVGTDNVLYSKPGVNGNPNLNANWVKTASPQKEWISSICIAPDGSIFCIGASNAIWKKNSYKNLTSVNWQYMGNNTCCVKAITIAPDGTFIGIGTDNKIYTKDNYKDLTTPWKGPYQNVYTNTNYEIIGITTIPNPNYNGAKFSSARQPNYNVNAPILTEVKGQAFWGTGGSSSDNVSGKTLQECSARCANTPNCSGATFNLNDHGRPYCFLRSGQGEPVPALTDDYAIVPKSNQLLKIVESLNTELNAVNRKMQKKIDQLYTIYGNQINKRFNQNYSLITQYDNLNKERKKIDDMIKEYQTLEESEIEMGLFITKNYYLFFIFFVVVFIAVIVLSMTSLDSNTTSVVTTNIINPAVTTTKEVINNINPFYVMFGIILVVVIVHLYNQYIYTIYTNMPSFKKMGQLGVVYFVFIIVIIFVAITYLYKNNGTSYFPIMNR